MNRQSIWEQIEPLINMAILLAFIWLLGRMK